jgi:predicted site-specific integrase-resolvase
MQRYADDPKMLTQNAAARALQVSAPTLRKWIALGYVRVVKVGPAESKIRRVPVSEVERLKREA